MSDNVFSIVIRLGSKSHTFGLQRTEAQQYVLIYLTYDQNTGEDRYWSQLLF